MTRDELRHWIRAIADESGFNFDRWDIEFFCDFGLNGIEFLDGGLSERDYMNEGTLSFFAARRFVMLAWDVREGSLRRAVTPSEPVVEAASSTVGGWWTACQHKADVICHNCM